MEHRAMPSVSATRPSYATIVPNCNAVWQVDSAGSRQNLCPVESNIVGPSTFSRPAGRIQVEDKATSCA